MGISSRASASMASRLRDFSNLAAELAHPPHNPTTRPHPRSTWFNAARGPVRPKPHTINISPGRAQPSAQRQSLGVGTFHKLAAAALAHQPPPPPPPPQKTHERPLLVHSIRPTLPIPQTLSANGGLCAPLGAFCARRLDGGQQSTVTRNNFGVQHFADTSRIPAGRAVLHVVRGQRGAAGHKHSIN